MAQLLALRSGNDRGAAAWGGSTALGCAEAAGDAVIAAGDGGATRGRFSFGPKDGDGRFAIYTPSGKLVLTVDGDGDVLLGHPSPGDARQRWRWGAGGRLLNSHTGRAATFVQTARGRTLSTRAPADADPAQVWSVAAAGPPINSPFALVNSVDANGNAQVVSIYYEVLGPGTPVYLETLAASSHGQLWLYTSTGTIVCAEDPNLLLTATSTGAVLVAAPLVAPANPAFQVWSFADGALVNLGTGQALTVAAPLRVQPMTPPPGPNQTWSWTPGYPLTVILNEPPVDFPAFTGDQATAYKDINTQLATTLEPALQDFDLREQYTNLAAPLSAWIADIQGYPVPPAVSPADWSAVTQQLIAELNDAISVQNLFAQYNAFHRTAFSTSVALLNQIGEDISVSSSTTVGSVGTALLEGVIYTVVSAIPEIGGILGNVFETAFNAAVASGTVSPSPFEVAYAKLWDQLTPGFDAVLQALGTQETSILMDWGMMQAVAKLILSDGPNSLNWPANSSPLVVAAQQGYVLAAMQMLVPTRFWVARWGGLSTSTPPIDNTPAGSSWGYGDYFANVFFAVVESDSQFTFPSSAVLADLSNNNGRASDFYPGKAGWNVTVVDGLQGSANAKWMIDTLLTTIVNMSDRVLSITLEAEAGSVQVIGNSTQTLPPYGTIDFASSHGNGLRIDVTVTDQATGAGQAFFRLHLEDEFLGGQKVWVDSQSSSNGFSIGTPVIQQVATPSYWYTCGSVTVPVFYIPALGPA